MPDQEDAPGSKEVVFQVVGAVKWVPFIENFVTDREVSFA